MTTAQCVVILTLLWTSTRADSEVSCVFMESCILPCSFQGGTDVVLHWNQVTAGDLPVHSYYDSQDQLTHQDQRLRGRTSLFKDQISRGNVSLLLTGVEVQDQGRYKCYCTDKITEINKESFVNLRVDAPVGKVDLQQVENSITCSSEGIYPEPELTWSTSPPSYVNLQHKTTKQRTEQLLYNISSSLTPSDDLVYSCTISTRSNWRRATLFKPTYISGSYYETTIPCTASNTSLTGFSLTWRFKHSQIILTQTRADVPYTVSEEWRQQVKGVSESGSLLLQDLSSYHEGIYTCELRDAEETLITNTFLRIHKVKVAASLVAHHLSGRRHQDVIQVNTLDHIHSTAQHVLLPHLKPLRKMTEAERKVFLVFVASLWMLNASGGDSEVSCVSKESCILPCSFQNNQSNTDVVVHWTVTERNLSVHSYYHNQDQLAHQDQRFRNRTSLFNEQISTGNASLQLTEVEVEDQGRYQCHTKTIREDKDSFINLRVVGNSTNVRDIKGAVVAAIVAAVAVLLLL